MEFIDYYKILGVSRNASQEEIQRAYRKRARKLHPDVNKEKNGEEEFKKLNEANEVLKDPEKRKLYDTYGENWQQGGFQQPSDSWSQQYRQGAGHGSSSREFRFSSDGSFGESSDFSDFFNSLFGEGFSQRHSHQHHSSTPGRSQEADITVSLADVVNGATKSISLQSYESSQEGHVRPVTKTFQVKIPRGVTNGSVIRLAGQGEKGSSGMLPGDLLLRIHIADDPRFRIDGYDLITVVPISPWEAALGVKVVVQTVDGSVTVTIPKGSQNRKKMRLRGKGLPNKQGEPGDLIVQLEIQIPTSLTKEEEALLQELAQKSKFNPRIKTKQRAGRHGEK